MSKTRPPYSKEFREQIVALVRAGRSVSELAEEFEPSPQTIYNWIAQSDVDRGLRQDQPTTAEREEIRRLKKEVRRLQQERDILGKAAAWFARETNSTREQPSDS